MATPLKKKRAEDRETAEKRQAKEGAKQMFKPTEDEAATQSALHQCLQNVDEAAHATYYEAIDCYDEALGAFRYNATWLKRLGTLHLLTGAPARAIELYNESVSMVFSLSRYETESPEMLANGAIGFLRLFSTRDLRSAVEAAKVMALNASYTGRTEDALHLFGFLFDDGRADDDVQLSKGYADFLMSIGMWSKVPVVLQRASEMNAYYKDLPSMVLALRMASEAVGSVARRLLSVATVGTTAAREAHLQKVQQLCGRPDLPLQQTYSRATLVKYTLDCFCSQLKLGSLRKALEGQASLLSKDKAGFLQTSPLHHLAMLGGSDHRLILRVLKLGIHVGEITRFGQSALHIALMMGHYSAAKLLVNNGASLAAKDVRQLTPLEYACKHAAWVDRRQVSDVIGECTAEDPCDLDDEPVVSHTKERLAKVHSGGWVKEAAKDETKVERLSLPLEQLAGMRLKTCQIDIRDASIDGMDLLMDYILVGKPVLLKGVFKAAAREQYEKKRVLEKLSGLRGRVEMFAEGELQGAQRASVMTLGAFMAQLPQDRQPTFVEKVPGTEAGVQPPGSEGLLPTRHPLYQLINLQPPFLSFNGLGFNDTEEIVFSVGKRGGGEGAQIRTKTAIHFMPYGTRRWRLYPPPHAFVSRKHPLDVMDSDSSTQTPSDPLQGRQYLECEQQDGDTLVIPPHWGAVAINLKESVLVLKKLDLDALWPA